MDLLERRDFYTRSRQLYFAVKPRPNTGSLWKDIVYLFLILFIQTSIIPSFFGSLLHFDLVTPWLVISFIRQKLSTATILALVAAIALETRSAAPAGLYLCTYWIAANIIVQVRPALSWRHQVPWIVTFFLTSLWVTLFEALIIMTMRGLAQLSWTYWGIQILRIASSVAFGIYLAQNSKTTDGEEPYPQ